MSRSTHHFLIPLLGHMDWRRPGSIVVYLLIYLGLTESSFLVLLDKGTGLIAGVFGSLKALTAIAEEDIRLLKES